MYEKYFGLAKNPFTMTPDPNCLFLTERHREALAGLFYAVMRRKGIVVLAGEAGTGKTTLLRKLVNLIPAPKAQTSFVLNPILSASEFLELMLLKFGVKDLPTSKAQRLLLLERLLHEAHEASRIPVLVIDEAHKLSFDVLEEIRLLANFETSEHKLLQIVLAGQPELETLLLRRDLWQFKQRVTMHLRIDRLSAKQMDEYIAYRWMRAGGDRKPPFEDDAFAEVVLGSKGIPRLINAICDNALLVAFSKNNRTVVHSDVLEALNDLAFAASEGAPEREQPQQRVGPAFAGPPAAPRSPHGSVNRYPKTNPESAASARDKAPFLARWGTRLKAL